MTLRPPAPNPCGSCPYRLDVPSGVWAAEEYEKLPRYDGETADQDPSVFSCHQQDGHLCAGWTAVHDMAESLGLRIAVMTGLIDPADFDAITCYTTDTPLFSSGAAAAEHGLRAITRPPAAARQTIDKLQRRRARRSAPTGGGTA